jgi:hypothetical protein
MTKKKAVKKVAKPEAAAEAPERAVPQVEERPAAVGAPGTVVNHQFPSTDSDSFIDALVQDAERSGERYVVIVQSESDGGLVRESTEDSELCLGVRVNASLGCRATWRKR